MQFCRKIRLKTIYTCRFRKIFTTTTTNANCLSSTSLLAQYSTSPTMSPHFKKFCFADYDLIGFDLDGTLLHYNLQEMVPLVYDLLRKFLVEQKGYPQSLLHKSLDKQFLQKGLILDAEHGNVLKLSCNATIIRATHGTKLLSSQQIIDTYGIERKWNISTQFLKNPLSTWNGPLVAKMRTLLDCFDMAASLVFGQAVDAIDDKTESDGKPPPLYTVWPDIHEGLIHIYSRENFSNGRSGYFNALRKNPNRYLLRTKPKVIEWLRELRIAGKSIFLLTGSNLDFANFTATYAFGDNWQQLFDCVIGYARKPGFFTDERPYFHASDEAELVPISLTEYLPLLNSAYSQGNWKQLRRSMAAKLEKTETDMRSLYVGDNLIQDVYAPVKQSGVDVVSLCDELLTDELNASLWGSYFCVDKQLTLWANIIDNYSQMCIPMVETIADKASTHKFHCEKSCYFPKAPTALTSESDILPL